MTNPSLVMVLVEDRRQWQFVYRFLVGCGVHPRRIEIEQSRAGRGSAKQWVSDQFARSVEKCRRRNSKAATCLLVMMDADQLTVFQCLGILDAALASSKQPKLDPTVEPIARLIPKWSIETWIIYLSSRGEVRHPISEDRSFKDEKSPEQWSELIPSAVDAFYKWTKTAASRPESLLDSLRLGLDEIPRTLPVGR
jgi:hypothetical protein